MYSIMICTCTVQVKKSHLYHNVPSRRSETEVVITLSYYAVCVRVYCAVPYRTYIFTVPRTVLLYYTKAGGAYFLINAHRKLFIYQRTTVQYSISVRNEHETVPVRHLYCTALNGKGNFFCLLLYVQTLSSFTFF